MESLSLNECVSFERINVNFETYFLIWLDQNLPIQEKLQSMINYFESFDQLDHCHTYIQSIASDDRIVFVVNEQFSQDIIPRIHHLQQIFSIYILCTDKQHHQTWSKQYHKVFLLKFFSPSI